MFKKTKIAAVSAVIFGLSGLPAHADGWGDHDDDKGVALNDGASGGEVLVFPYYNVNNQFITIYNITNTTDAYKAIKVRFRESENSNDVMDFNVYLSPYDVFTMELKFAEGEQGDSGKEGGVLLTTQDKSCVHPAIPEGGLNFRYGIYDSTSLDDVREGYLEVIEMGEIDEDAYVQNIETGDPQYIASEGVLHKPNGDPKDCSVIETAWQQAVFVQGGAKSNGYKWWNPSSDINWVNPAVGGEFGQYPLQPVKSQKGYYGEKKLYSQAENIEGIHPFTAFHGTAIDKPKGGIVGSSILVDLATIIGFVVEPTSILYYSDKAQHYLSSDDNFQHLPSLASGNNKLAYRSQGELIEYDLVERDWGLDDRSTFPKHGIPSGINPMPVSDAMLVSTLGNQYFLGTGTVSDLVIAAPMRKHAIYNNYKYVPGGEWSGVALPDEYIAVSSLPGQGAVVNGETAEKYGYWEFLDANEINSDLTYYDREEAFHKVDPQDFSPTFGDDQSITIANEVNIFALRPYGAVEHESVLGSNNAKHLELNDGFINGWLNFSFNNRGYDLKGKRYRDWLGGKCGHHMVDPLAPDAVLDPADESIESECARTVFMKDEDEDKFSAEGVPLHGFMATRVPANGGFVGEAFPHFYTRDRGSRNWHNKEGRAGN